MQKPYMAIIKIPFTLADNGSMTPHQDRYAIDFQSIDELPPINREEHGALLQQLLSSNNDAQSSENIKESDENIREPDENIREPDENIKEPDENISDPTENISDPTENIRESDENISDPTENIRESDDDSHIENKSSEPKNHHPLMVSIREFMNRPSPKQSNTISFKNRPHSARKNRSAKKRHHHANDLQPVSRI